MHVSSRELLTDLFEKLEAEKINVFKVNTSGFRHNTIPEEHPTRNEYINLRELENIKASPEDIVCVSTTFLNNKGKYVSFIGLDIEYPPNEQNKTLIETVSAEIGAKHYLLKTLNGYHVFIPEVYDDDLKLWSRISEFLDTTATILNHTWLAKYTSKFKKAKSFENLQHAAESILKTVGHFGDEKVAFVDLRHLAHSLLSNERCRGKKDDRQGIRTQAFFRMSKRHDQDFEPYLI